MMMGPPQFPDHPIPTWEEFCTDYSDRFFCPEGDGFGRIFVIGAGQREVGCISYDGLDKWHGLAELDIWIGSSANWGHGWGSMAIRDLSERLLRQPEVEYLIMRPSRRNARAIAAYRKAGFVFYDPALHQLPESVLTTGLDYADAVVLVLQRSLAPSAFGADPSH
jgi:diamine N-acetyltransferase